MIVLWGDNWLSHPDSILNEIFACRLLAHTLTPACVNCYCDGHPTWSEFRGRFLSLPTYLLRFLCKSSNSNPYILNHVDGHINPNLADGSPFSVAIVSFLHVPSYS